MQALDESSALFCLMVLRVSLVLSVVWPLKFWVLREGRKTSALSWSFLNHFSTSTPVCSFQTSRICYNRMWLSYCGKLNLFSFQIHATCQGPILRVNSTQLYAEVLIPYPEVGTWHLNIQGQPLAAADTVTADMEFLPVKLTVKLDQCVKGSCGPRGTCRVSLNSGALITSACVCQAGWKGWDCSDSSSADSMSDLLVSVIFLTISNLIFIPATVVAIRRKYFTEAVVYGCTCFFSSFYHACDQPLKSMTLCIMEYSVLQFCDFYVSILSFWVTIIAMADLPLQLKSIAHCVGSIGIALGVEYEKTGLWVFAVPALTAVLILAGSWGLRWVKSSHGEIYENGNFRETSRRLVIHITAAVPLRDDTGNFGE